MFVFNRRPGNSKYIDRFFLIFWCFITGVLFGKSQSSSQGWNKKWKVLWETNTGHRLWQPSGKPLWCLPWKYRRIATAGSGKQPLSWEEQKAVWLWKCELYDFWFPVITKYLLTIHYVKTPPSLPYAFCTDINI